MPYRVQVQSNFEWRVGWSVNGSAPWNRLATGGASSLADAQAQAQNVVVLDRAAKQGRSDALIYDQSFVD